MRQRLHVERRQRLGNAAFIARLAGGPLRHRQVVMHRQRGAQMQLLRQKANGVCTPGIASDFAERAQGLPGHCDVTVRGGEQPRRQRQPGRFARTGCAAQQQQTTLRHVHILKAKFGPAGVAIGELTDADHADKSGWLVAQSTHTPRTAKSRLMPW